MEHDSQASDARLVTAIADKSLLHDFSDDTQSRAGSRVVSAPSTRHLPASLFRYRVIKRVLDIVLVILSLPVLIPALLLVAALVRFTSPGPVFFSHRRICREGTFFSMWKFRTMCVNSSEVLEQHLSRNPAARAEWSRTHKLRVDPRITSVGLFLRRFSLDELPQVWNVLSGEMSLVGTTPHRRRRGREVRRVLRRLLPRQARRHRPLAGVGPQQAHLRRARRAGLRIRRPLVNLQGHQDSGQYLQIRRQPGRSLLALSSFAQRRICF